MSLLGHMPPMLVVDVRGGERYEVVSERQDKTQQCHCYQIHFLFLLLNPHPPVSPLECPLSLSLSLPMTHPHMDLSALSRLAAAGASCHCRHLQWWLQNGHQWHTVQIALYWNPVLLS